LILKPGVDRLSLARKLVPFHAALCAAFNAVSEFLESPCWARQDRSRCDSRAALFLIELVRHNQNLTTVDTRGYELPTVEEDDAAEMAELLALDLLVPSIGECSGWQVPGSPDKPNRQTPSAPALCQIALRLTASFYMLVKFLTTPHHDSFELGNCEVHQR